MDTKTEILFMQARLLRLAAKKWRVSIAQANAVFSAHKVWSFITEGYPALHTEGDEAVFEEISVFLKRKRQMAAHLADGMLLYR
ncbi:MAG: DUF3791 domain-containing protein [Succinivibrio sp.]|jgi:thymidine kinase|nr:DUF3791 domain-containing protein [Succinivibrio sp.]